MKKIIINTGFIIHQIILIFSLLCKGRRNTKKAGFNHASETMFLLSLFKFQPMHYTHEYHILPCHSL